AYAKFFIAFATVLALIGITAWLVRRFGGDRLGGGNVRGRQPRLAVIDAATVDARRRLVLIRRDNVEHLLLIGGLTDIVVEPNIVRAAALRETTREPARVEPPRIEAARPEPALRQAAPVDNGWPLQPVSEPAPPAPPPRSYRAAADEPWLAAEPNARPRQADSSSLTGLAAELSTKLHVQEPAPVRAEPAYRAEPALRSEPVMRSEPPLRHEPAPIRHEPPVRAEPTYRAEPAPRSETPVLRSEPRHSPALAATAEPAAGQNDHNLAEMAQQLEAALRRPPAPEARPPVTDPLAATQPAVADQRPAGRDYKLRVDPQFETQQAVKAEPRFEAQPEPRPQETREHRARSAAPVPGPQPTAPQAGPPQVFNSLEEEMASLLGRPPGKP
ncbi:MAG: hypothetical protein GC182_02490, partial [Rhodopseudomonas sp.]|nr:hypothetical protein [Rhodopseudomonas sp.]